MKSCTNNSVTRRLLCVCDKEKEEKKQHTFPRHKNFFIFGRFAAGLARVLKVNHKIKFIRRGIKYRGNMAFSKP